VTESILAPVADHASPWFDLSRLPLPAYPLTASSSLQVYSLPPQLLTSPYLDQLYAPMSDFGIDVQRTRPRLAIPGLLRGREPRVLHIHFFDELTQHPNRAQTAVRSLAFLALLRALKLRGVRLIWTAHNLSPHELLHPDWGFVVYRLAARWCDAVIAHSYAARTMLEDSYGSLPHCAVIPHGSYIDLYGPRRNQAESRATLGLPSGRILLNIGTLRPYKNIEGLIDAFSLLPETSRGTLLIVGAAKSQTYAESLRHKVEQTPGAQLRLQFVPDEVLPLYLAAANAVVLPYHSLLTSGILLWALSYARPVIAPAFGPVAELVREGEQGFLFAPGDQDSLRTALERALTHPDLESLGASGLSIAREFAWPRIAAATAECYRRVAWREQGRGNREEG
jgi:glycosyltransferase involved in cell wall biosynthesis